MGVWIYTLLAVIVEVYAAEYVASATALVVGIALTQAAAVLFFYMDLKDEPGSVVIMFLIPIMFLSGLLISVVASLG
jgi:heme/copper-type cytochrome/quinol oxidase subunit 4